MRRFCATEYKSNRLLHSYSLKKLLLNVSESADPNSSAHSYTLEKAGRTRFLQDAN